MKEGCRELPGLISPDAARAFREKLTAMRDLGPGLFLSEREWDASPRTHRHTNPGPGFNIIEKMQAVDPQCLDFVEKNPALRDALAPLLGDDFIWQKKKIVYRMLRSNLPAWLRAKLQGRLSNSLGGFVRPEFRDIAYYLEHDFHQDIIDWNRMPESDKTHRTVTFYIHLDDVDTGQDAPLVLLPGTHRFGATPYQHDVTRIAENGGWLYRHPSGMFEAVEKGILGPAGHALVFHACLLHAAHTVRQGQRLILRYTLACGKGDTGLDRVNASLTGPLYLETDYNAGERVNGDGLWELAVSDFIRMNQG